MATVARPVMASTHFFDRLSLARRGVLVLDFDSTIAQLGPADAVFPYPTVQELLDCITSMTATRVVVVSGRPAGDLRRFFAPPGPEICRPETVRLAGEAPVAYLTGEARGRGLRLRVHPEFRLGGKRGVSAPAEELVQFLADWLRACAGEVC